jgi:hypothetical protein
MPVYALCVKTRVTNRLGGQMCPGCWNPIPSLNRPRLLTVLAPRSRGGGVGKPYHNAERVLLVVLGALPKHSGFPTAESSASPRCRRFILLWPPVTVPLSST